MEKLPEILTPPPGEKAKKNIEESEKFLVTSTRYLPLVVKTTKNAVVEDVDGNKYIDFTAAVSVSNIGHCNPKVGKVIKEQVDRLINFAGQDFYNGAQLNLAKLLADITPGNFSKKAFFSNSGTEAVECAIKLTSWKTKNSTLISFIGGFHGRTLGSLSMTGSKPVQRKNFFPFLQYTVHVPYAYCYRCIFQLDYPDCGLACVDYIEEWCFRTFLPPENVAGLVVEPIQGESGYIVPPDGWLKEVKNLCRKYGIPFIVDEVQSGFCRTGKMFCCEHWDVEPDIICLAKSIANGFPLGATVAKADFDFTESGAHSNTFGGNVLACTAALETIKIMLEEKVAERAEKLGKNALKRLCEMAEEHTLIGDVRGKGLMIGIEFVKDKKTKEPARGKRNKAIQTAFKKGLILLPGGYSSIRIAPPLTIEEELLEKGLEILDETLKTLK